MGTVYMAEQEHPVRRRVAFKIIKPGMDSAQVLARFEAERQALALMDHQHIAKVFDAGATDAGRPYFAMELVHGVPITKYCDDNRLTPRERLELFVPVCQAIQHAHQKGIIHRDIKPSNILVCLYDSKPVAKVIDFGVAKATDQRLTERTMFTQYGNIVGTFEYMSPEQAEMSQLGIDTRSDIFSLGVLLYELLTGTTPLERKRLRSAAFTEMLRIIKEEEPPKPSTRITESKESLASLAAHRKTEPAKLAKLVRGELDWIVMKCLEKDRTRRYETANGLARDIQRYLADEPVEACPPSAGYKLRKFARKYKMVLATAAAFVGLLVVGVVVSTWQAVRATVAERSSRAAEAQAREDRDRAVRAEAEAREQQKKTAAAEASTRREADKTQTINQFLVEDLLTQAEPGQNAPVDRVPLLEVVDRAAAKVGKRFRDQPLLEASLRGTLGDVYHGLAAYDKAEQHWSVALALRRRELGADHAETYRAMSKQAHMLMHLGQREESAGLLRAAAAGLTRGLGPDHADTGYANASLAYTYLNLRRYDEAISLCKQTLKKQKAALAPDHFVTLNWLMDCLARAYLDTGRLHKAMPQAKQALEKTKATLGPDHPRTLMSMWTLADVYRAADQVDKALPLYEQWLEKTKAKFGPDHGSTLRAMAHLAGVYAQAKELNRAVPVYRELLDAQSRKLPADHPDRASTMASLGQCLLNAGKPADAEPVLRKCLAIREKKLPDNWLCFNAQSLLGGSLLGQKKYAEAEPLLLKGYEGMKQRQAKIPRLFKQVRLTQALERLVQLYDAWDKKDEAAKWRKELEAGRK
jgi:tetratricopeptide (TPR) repeat protein/tRNA A-37 threonylcarbamoyl transferase component Bud32